MNQSHDTPLSAPTGARGEAGRLDHFTTARLVAILLTFQERGPIRPDVLARTVEPLRREVRRRERLRPSSWRVLARSTFAWNGEQ